MQIIMKILKNYLKAIFYEVIKERNLHFANSWYNPHKLPKGGQNMLK
jgi:hypothetical protein